MALAAESLLVSRKDYLEGELKVDAKYEFVAGQVYAMAGGTVNHQRVARNFSAESLFGLKGKPCEPSGSDLLLRVDLGDSAEAFYYPDGMIICEPLGGADRFTEAPTVILEVLSLSTRRIDELQKLRDYFTIPSLKVYLLAEADEPLIRVYRRRGEKFEMEMVAGMEAVLSLPEVELELPLSELYRDVDLLAKEVPPRPY